MSEIELINQRKGYKVQAKLALTKLEKLSDAELKETFNVKREKLVSYLDRIQTLDGQILNLHINAEISDEDLETIAAEQEEYIDEMQERLSAVDKRCGTPRSTGHDVNSSNATHDSPLVPIKIPKLEVRQFDGSSNDKLEFKNFLTQFDNCVGSGGANLNDAIKLTYLRGYLGGKAFKLISHLSVNEDNYQVARDILTKEYLDLRYIIDESFKRLLNMSPSFDSNFEGLKSYISECRAILHDLKVYDVDLLDEGTAGCKFVSHVIFHKLPPSIRKELMNETTTYPSVNEVFAHYSEIVKKLQRASQTKVNQFKPVSASYQKGPAQGPTKRFYNGGPPSTALVPLPLPRSTVENFNTSVRNQANPRSARSHVCKFCSGPHTAVHCEKFSSFQERKKRCVELKLCQRCTSELHGTESCPGKENNLKYGCSKCKALSHATSLCAKINVNGSTFSNYCLNMHSVTSGISHLLPVLSLKFFGTGNRSSVIRCLIDTGSERSYIAADLVKLLRGDTQYVASQYTINTFLGSAPRSFGECQLRVQLPGRKLTLANVLIVPDFKIELNVGQLPLAINNILQSGVNLAETSLAWMGESVPIMGLIGVDLLQKFSEFSLTSCMKGAAFSTCDGLIPFGCVDNFLHRGQILPAYHPSQLVEEVPVNLNESNIAQEYDRSLETYVNFVLEPQKTYASALEPLFPESSVEQGLESMFSVDSLGHNEEVESDYDRLCIKKFQQGISLQNGRYHVELPWKEELIEKVPSNHKIALAVMNRVESDLDRKGLLASYQEVFCQQLSEGIIEEIEVQPKDYDKYIWIPHRPVIKTDENVTTKIRPVFNCSLKVNSSPSLNEAAYPGVNLIKELVQMSLYFRSNKYTLLSDIKQAFLQIRLAKESDKNRFCFFMRFGKRLVAFRYTTILFGFNASPFILSYVLKHHANTCPNDEFSRILKDNFYVDNMMFTSNNPKYLQQVFLESNKRLEQGGFSLRSWNTNNAELQSTMKDHGKLAQHGNAYEKVLGMKYMLETDTLQLNNVTLDPSANTKRTVLSQVSKVFDPMGLFLPVTNTGKFLLRDLWAAKKGWDEEIPPESPLIKRWPSHCTDVSSLSTVFFPRSCVNEEADNSLVIFTDASSHGYGFAVYSISNGTSNLLFAKSRVAPIKKKSLATLELLGVHHALKSLPIVLKSFAKVKFPEITIGVDSQIVLQWLHTDKVNTKNIFTRNRIKDIAGYMKSLYEEFGVTIQYRYVKSEENPSDCLTHGLSFNDFSKQLSFWQHGPSWLPRYQELWPDYSLGCLSESSQRQVAPRSTVNAAFNAVQVEPVNSIVDLKRFSSFHKAVRVTTLVFKFIHKCRKSTIDSASAAKHHLLHHMQSECFQGEIAYLSIPNENKPKEVPNLVNNLDLFLDEKGLVRSRGRIAKSLRVSYDVQNPVLLGKEHPLSRLLIEFFHSRCKHLGVQTTVNKMRTGGFWIPQMRQAVKNVLKDCVTCQKYNALSFRYPRMTNLPKDRVNLVRPFECTGVDFTSHLWVKNEKGEMVKVYIVIFTCLSLRAIHLELVPDMSTLQFILAFTRFVNLHGIPTHLYSDNARSFVTAGEILQKALISHEYKSTFEPYGIKHIRIPLYSAWVGATWERLIRTVKSCLHKAVGRATVSYFELFTTLTDIQNAVNSRPLTYRSSENDLESITPSCFLKAVPYGDSILRLNEKPIWEHDPPTRDDLLTTLSVRDEILAHFKELWYEAYLLSLRETSKDLHQVNWNDKIAIDDIVLVKLANKTRPHWVLGRVLELIRGHDDKVRSVRIKRGDGATVLHSINHLYPLELSLTHNVQLHDVNQHPSGEVQSVPNVEAPSEPVSLRTAAEIETGQRPSRAAAVAGRSKVKTWARVLQ